MRRLAIGLLLLACFVASALPSAAASARAHSVAESWTKVTGGARDYWLYVPGGTVSGAGRPMVVYLHGCTQNNETDPQVAFGTRWNELAKRVGAVVLYPLQRTYDTENPESMEGNGGSCWNWFLPQNMRRGRGEPALLAAITRRVAQQNFVDLNRIYVMGASAGADMANILGLTYPDVFRASAMFAGCAYYACRDALGLRARKESARIGLKPGPAIVFQGDADTVNNVAMGKSLLEQHINMRRIARTPASTRQYGDPTGIEQSYPYTVKKFVDRRGRAVVEWWVIHGLGHTYPNGDMRSTYTDQRGPDVTSGAWRFFTATSR